MVEPQPAGRRPVLHTRLYRRLPRRHVHCVVTVIHCRCAGRPVTTRNDTNTPTHQHVNTPTRRRRTKQRRQFKACMRGVLPPHSHPCTWQTHASAVASKGMFKMSLLRAIDRERCRDSRWLQQPGGNPPPPIHCTPCTHHVMYTLLGPANDTLICSAAVWAATNATSAANTSGTRRMEAGTSVRSETRLPHGESCTGFHPNRIRPFLSNPTPRSRHSLSLSHS